MNPSIDGIIDSIKNGSTIRVSDGSFQMKFGIACWIIDKKCGSERIVGLIDVPGCSDEHDAYRSELAGLYDIVNIV